VAYRIYLYEEHGFLGCVYDLISLSSWLFLWFLIYGMVQVLVLSVVVNF